jgi:hypothetical protein
MVVLGVWTATASLARHSAEEFGRVYDRNKPIFDAKFAYIVPITDILIFATLIFLAFRNRSNPAAHKRFVLIATIALTEAAIGRWPFAFVHNGVSFLIQFGFLLPIVAYDLWSTGKIHRATLWASVFLLFLQVIKIPIGFTNVWRAFATSVSSVAR